MFFNVPHRTLLLLLRRSLTLECEGVFEKDMNHYNAWLTAGLPMRSGGLGLKRA